MLAGTEVVPAHGETTFAIVASTSAGSPDASVTPDAATCAACLREPFIRPLTTMAGFEMCDPCAAEYHDPRTAASTPSPSKGV